MVLGAIQEVEQALPFALRGVDCDNGSEFINWNLQAWRQGKNIELTGGRPYKKDDNAHVEQKNWTHVRKLLGWDRYDSVAAVEAINDLYRQEAALVTEPLSALGEDGEKDPRRIEIKARV